MLAARRRNLDSTGDAVIWLTGQIRLDVTASATAAAVGLVARLAESDLVDENRSRRRRCRVTATTAAAAVAVAVAERHGATVDTNGYYVDADDDNVKTKKHVVVVVVVAAAAEVEKVDNETWQYEDGREVSEVNGHVDDDWDLHLLPDGIVSQDRAELNRCPDRLFDLNC